MNIAPAASYNAILAAVRDREALTLMQGYADATGGDAGLKAGAAKAAPKVQMHLDKAKAIQAAMK